MIHLGHPHNKRRLYADVCYYEDAQGLSFLSINNELAQGTIALQGAHLMHWQPTNALYPVLWLSSNTRYVAGRSIRGGIPICWPWFGAHPTDSSYCVHGFARVIPWQLRMVTTLADGATRLQLEMIHTEETRKQLSYSYLLQLEITIGSSLRLELMTTNLAQHPFMIGEAFHTYFLVGDIANVRIVGLENSVFADKVMGYERNVQHGPLEFDGEFDRAYLYSSQDCVVQDSALNRSIRVNKSNSHSTVIWTPWAEKASQMADMGEGDEWRRMLCVESANAMQNNVMIYPNETHNMAAEYHLEN